MLHRMTRYAARTVVCLLVSTSAWAQTQAVDVLTWNVHKPRTFADVDRQMDFVAALNPRPDIIVLQEVRELEDVTNRSLPNEYRDRLKQQTGESWDYTIYGKYCSVSSCAQLGPTGVMILSRFPATSAETRLFTYQDQYSAGRVAARMAVNVNGTIINVFDFHFTADAWGDPTAEDVRRQMAIEVKSWSSQVAPVGPRLLAGDFNATPNQPAIVPPDGMTGATNGVYRDAWVVAPGSGSGATSPSSGLRVDYWFSDDGGGAQATFATVPNSGAMSDHAPVLVTYQIPGATVPSATTKINFQPALSPVPSGYLADTGSVFGDRGNGFSYGWNFDNSGQTRDRNLATDQAFDTLAYMQRPENPNAAWEIAVPNGTYKVRVVVGDPQYVENDMAIAAEGIVVVSGHTTAAQPWLDGTAVVLVSDGRLSIESAAGAVGNKICFIEMTSAPLKINFQLTAPAPDGYLADTGLAFGNRGNGWTYGWNIDSTGVARDRNQPNSPDEAHDTLIYMQRPENPDASWEIALPNGTYSVRIVAGDPQYFDNDMAISGDGIVIINGRTTTSDRWLDSTVPVTVTDGRLTIANAAGAVGNKICFIEIKQ